MGSGVTMMRLRSRRSRWRAKKDGYLGEWMVKGPALRHVKGFVAHGVRWAFGVRYVILKRLFYYQK